MSCSAVLSVFPGLASSLFLPDVFVISIVLYPVHFVILTVSRIVVSEKLTCLLSGAISYKSEC